MAVYTTLFSATHAELEERFPNVADPLPAPRTVTRRNPFTKQTIDVQVYEPEFGPPRHQRSLFAEDQRPAVEPVVFQDDDYGRYLYSLVPDQLRSLPHVGAKNVMFIDAEELLLLDAPPEKFVKCLPDEGVVDVGSAALVEALTQHDIAELRERCPEADDFPFEWLRDLLLASPGSGRRYLCAWYQE